MAHGDETELGNYGEGVSRPRHNARVNEFTVLITLPSSHTRSSGTRARNQSVLLQKYARNRWPLAVVVEVL
jgi:hypothetical protein